MLNSEHDFYKLEIYRTFAIETYLIDCWYYDVFNYGEYIKASCYGFASREIAIKRAKEYIDAQIKFAEARKGLRENIGCFY
jgi:hypothetical protein